VAVIDLQGAGLQLLLPLLEGGLDAVQPYQVGLVLSLSLFQSGLLLGKLALALLQVGDALLEDALHLLLPVGEGAGLLLARPAFAVELLAAGLHLGLAQAPFLLQRRDAGAVGVELAAALQLAAGDAADGALFLGQALAPLLVALVELLADLVQLAAQG